MAAHDQLWDLMNDVEIPSGKICIFLSGGLDSRVLAGIISRKRPVDLAAHYWMDHTEHDLVHVKKLAEIIGIKNLEIIHKQPGEEIHSVLNKKYPLKEYTYLVNIHGDILTGINKFRGKDRAYWHHGAPVIEGKAAKHFGYFKAVQYPFLTTQITGYLCSLNWRQRFFQHTYRKMIQKYMPELWQVPRCFEIGKPVSLQYYVPKRIITKMFS